MERVVIATTHTDIIERLSIMVKKNILPKANYIIVAEFYEATPPSDTKEFDLIVINELDDLEEINNIIEKLKRMGKIDKVVQTDEYAVCLAAYIKQGLELDNNAIENSKKFRDKVIMKQKLSSKIRVPKLYSLEELYLNKIKFPIILKPRAFAGSRGVKKFETLQEVKKFLNSEQINIDYLNNEFSEFSMIDYEIEEFIAGDVYHIDGIISEGKIGFLEISQYINNCLEYLEGIPLGSIFCNIDKDKQIKLGEFSNKVCEILEVPDGAFHLEAFINSESEFIFLEIGVRPGGALIVKTIEIAYGLNIDELHLIYQLGQKNTIPILKAQKNHCGWVLFPKHNNENIVVSITLPILKNNSIVWKQLPVIGEKKVGAITYTDTLGSFILKNENYQFLKDDMNELINKYNVKLVYNEKTT